MNDRFALPDDGHAPVLRLLATLTRSSPDDVDSAFDTALRELGRFAGADRCYIFERRSADTIRNTYEWVAEGVSPAIDTLDAVPLSVIDRWMPAFRRGEPVEEVGLDRLPDNAPLKPILASQDIRALLVVPFMDGARFEGMIGFDNTRTETPFPAAAIRLLRAAADLIWTTLTRVRTEGRLRDANARMGALLEAMPDLVFELDEDRRFTGVAAGPPALLSEHDTRAGRPLSETLPPDTLARFETGLDAVFAGVTARPQRYRVDRDGTARWHEVDFSPIRGADGRKGALCVIRDVTEDEQARRRLERMSKAAEMMTNHVILSTPDGLVEWANRAFLERSGYTLDDMVGRPLIDFTRSPESDPEAVQAIADATRRGEAFSGEIVNRTRAGEDYWVDLNISCAQVSDDGRAVVINVGTDVTALKQAERSAAESRRILENAMDALPDAFAYFDAQDRLVVCNERYRDFYPLSAPAIRPGVGFEALVRHGVAQGEFLDARGREQEWIRQRLADHATPGDPIEQALSNGRRIRVVEQATADGGRVGMRMDITELKRAEERLANVIQGAAVGAWEWTPEPGGVAVNPRFAKILRRDHAALDGVDERLFISLIPDPDRGRVASAMQALLVGAADTFDDEFRMQRGDGSTVWVEVRGRVLARDGTGRAIRVAGVLMDISARKESEDALIRVNARLTEAMARRDAAEKRFLDIAAVSDDWFFELDANLRHAYLSRNFEKLLGRPARAMLRQPLDTLFPDAPGSAQWAALTAKLEARAPFSDAIFEHDRADDGRRIWLRLSGTPIHDPVDGRFVGYRCVGSDVTALYAERLRAIEASAAKGRLLATMSHEIRTPLNGILGMAELLEPQLHGDRQRDMLSTIRASGELLVGILDNLLDMSKIEAGQLELDRAPLIPHDVAEKTMRLFREQAQQKELGFALEARDDARRVRLGDAHRLQQILQNLVSNAVKFTNAGHVTVRLSAPEGQPLVIEVADSGIGMSPEQSETVFEAYRQADSRIASRYGGTGLGLSIVHDLVSAMGGFITVDSELDAGTRFRITLPLPEVLDDAQPGAAPRTGSAAQAAEAPGHLQDKRLLLADDSATNLAVLRGLLRRTGAQCSEAEDGAQAVDLWRRKAGTPARTPFDLLLLDIAMPERNGREALADIRALEAEAGLPATPAIAVTADVMPEQTVESIAAGFDAVLAKPFGRAELVGMAARILDPAGARTDRTAPISRDDDGVARVLIADDDPVAREILAEFLSAAESRLDLRIAVDGRETLQHGLSQPFGLIVLDQNMPGIPGDRVIRALRACRSPNSATPMMLISGDVAHRRDECGAPDVVLPKPVDKTRFVDAVRRLSAPTAAE